MFINQINRLQQLDQLIRQKRTGNADELATTLGISRRQVYNWLDELKSLGLEIGYDRYRQSFIYNKPYHIKIDIKVKELSKEDAKKLNAGINFSKKNYFVQ